MNAAAAAVARMAAPRSALDRTALSVFERVLVTTDGTVTALLEDWLEEVIVVHKLPAPAQAPDGALDWLGASTDTEVELRAVLLCGAQSAKPCLCGESVLVSRRLPSVLRAALRDTDVPLGTLLRHMRLESFREVIDAWSEPAAALAPYFGLPSEAELVARASRITLNGAPCALIVEKFPRALFLDDAAPRGVTRRSG